MFGQVLCIFKELHCIFLETKQDWVLITQIWNQCNQKKDMAKLAFKSWIELVKSWIESVKILVKG
jgi:hypothetical protein